MSTAAIILSTESGTMDPRHYVASETLKDGTLVTVRAIRRDDADPLLKAFNNLDRESVTGVSSVPRRS